MQSFQAKYDLSDLDLNAYGSFGTNYFINLAATGQSACLQYKTVKTVAFLKMPKVFPEYSSWVSDAFLITKSVKRFLHGRAFYWILLPNHPTRCTCTQQTPPPPLLQVNLASFYNFNDFLGAERDSVTWWIFFGRSQHFNQYFLCVRWLV